MAYPKVLGIETEYGIHQKGVELQDQRTASALVVASYLELLEANFSSAQAAQVAWNHASESPHVDMRNSTSFCSGYDRDDMQRFLDQPSEIMLHAIYEMNAILPNGARLYVDHAHPEYSTPECSNARDVALFDRAGELLLNTAVDQLNTRDDHMRNTPVSLYKNNTDHKGNSYGTHENYLVDRSVDFGAFIELLPLHLVSRQIYTGAGKVALHHDATTANNHSRYGYQLTQRADFFEALVGIETTFNRPIINTRDEPHADRKKYRRLHVIVGDANMSEYTTWLKAGSTLIVLAMIEHGVHPKISFKNPLEALKCVSGDLKLDQPLQLGDGRKANALEIQFEIYEAAQHFVEQYGNSCCGRSDAAHVLTAWSHTLQALENSPESLSDRIDWIAKKKLLDTYSQAHQMSSNDPRLVALDLQYHDISPKRGLARKLKVGNIFSTQEIRAAVENPPADTRAFLRGTCVSKFSRIVSGANWDSLSFLPNTGARQVISMPEPLGFNKAEIADTLEGFSDTAELFAFLAEGKN